MLAKQAEKLSLPYFRPGEAIPVTGIYRVFHAQHRVSHEVTLLAGEVFPRCAKCDSDVHFELITQASQAKTDSDFRIRLFEVPHPREEEKEQKSPDHSEKSPSDPHIR